MVYVNGADCNIVKCNFDTQTTIIPSYVIYANGTGNAASDFTMDRSSWQGKVSTASVYIGSGTSRANLFGCYGNSTDNPSSQPTLSWNATDGKITDCRFKDGVEVLNGASNLVIVGGHWTGGNPGVLITGAGAIHIKGGMFDSSSGQGILIHAGSGALSIDGWDFYSQTPSNYPAITKLGTGRIKMNGVNFEADTLAHGWQYICTGFTAADQINNVNVGNGTLQSQSGAQTQKTSISISMSALTVAAGSADVITAASLYASTITAATVTTTGLVSATVAATAGLYPGATITIASAAGGTWSNINGSQTVLTVPNATTFTFFNSPIPTGTYTASTATITSGIAVCTLTSAAALAVGSQTVITAAAGGTWNNLNGTWPVAAIAAGSVGAATQVSIVPGTTPTGTYTASSGTATTVVATATVGSTLALDNNQWVTIQAGGFTGTTALTGIQVPIVVTSTTQFTFTVPTQPGGAFTTGFVYPILTGDGNIPGQAANWTQAGVPILQSTQSAQLGADIAVGAATLTTLLTITLPLGAWDIEAHLGVLMSVTAAEIDAIVVGGTAGFSSTGIMSGAGSVHAGSIQAAASAAGSCAIRMAVRVTTAGTVLLQAYSAQAFTAKAKTSGGITGGPYYITYMTATPITL
jgi:hypothetical protein